VNYVDNKNFNEYVEKYKNLPLQEKKELVEKEIKDIIAIMDIFIKKSGKDSQILYNKELQDLKKENATEDDFVEAMFVYTHTIKELFASMVDALNQ
jgi:acetate kinase